MLKCVNLKQKRQKMLNLKIDWENTKAAAFRSNSNLLKAISDIDFVALNSLVGIDFQKNALLKNTENFLADKGGNHALLWGERGCGKSSLCKAVFTEFFDKNLRVIEISKGDLQFLVDILDEIRKIPFKFIIFCDDLSFENGDDSYKYLKPMLEGSLEKAPTNALMYATSNRRHLLSEYVKDNQEVSITQDEIHYGDAVNERISLSDRFGLQLSFYQGNFDDYLQIVDNYFSEFKGDRTALHESAKQFSMLRASRSGRVAKQFYLAYKSEFL